MDTEFGCGAQLSILAYVGGSLGIVTIVARFMVKCTSQGRSRLPLYARPVVEDWLALGAVFFDVVLLAANLAATSAGYGCPLGTLSPDQAEMALAGFWISQIAYKAVMSCTKLSMLFFNLGIFRTDPHFRLLTQTWIGFVAVYTIAAMIATIFQCTPVTLAFEKGEHGHCINTEAFWVVGSVWSIVSDSVTALMLLIPLKKLQVPYKERTAIFAVFATFALIVIGCAVGRMTVLPSAAKNTDPSAGTLGSNVWTEAETSVAILVGNSVIVPQLVKRYRESRLSASGHESGTSSGSRLSNKGPFRRMPQRSSDASDQIELRLGANSRRESVLGVSSV